MKTSQWNDLAGRELRKLIKISRDFPTLRKLAPVLTEIDVTVVGSAKMRALNGQYRKIDRPTDILSFPSAEPFFSQGHLGSLVVCLPVMKKQAKQNGVPERVELKVLLTHGLLHLLGMDHEKSAKEAKKMALWENKLLSAWTGGKYTGLIRREG